ncbi:MAG: four helix bundle protein [Zetaproteobacteria bacterium]|nr:four helix bundle protein [Zetaproteobacteria bacterium]
MKIDSLYTDCLELALSAGYAPKAEKLRIVARLNTKIDALKFFLKVLWDLKGLDNNKYAILSTHLAEIGKMIGGWMKYLK